MKIGLVGPSYAQRSLPFDAQRTINLFPVMDEAGKEVASLYGTPGLLAFTLAGGGPIRGALRSGNERVFFVSGATLFESDSNGTVTSRGTFLTSNGTVSLCEGTSYLAVCDGDKLYSFQYATNTFAQVTDADLPDSVGYVTNIGSYFVVNENGTGKFFISAIENPTAWDALDFATAEANSDILVAPVNAIGQLWLFGKDTTEIWTNSGASTFPFSRISGAIMSCGLLAKHSAIELDNSVFWVGRDKFGTGIVYRANGFTPQRISTTPIELRIGEATAPEEILAWSYQEDGHLFLVLTGGGLETSLVYDVSTQQWHERAYLNADGVFEQHLGSCHISAFGRHLIGSRIDGTIYDMSMEYYDDNGATLARERVFTHLTEEMKRRRYNSLELGFETGVGTSEGQGRNPQVGMQLSRDGARTWSNWFTRSIGAIGEYLAKVRFLRLGVHEQLTIKIRITDPVKVAITGSYLN